MCWPLVCLLIEQSLQIDQAPYKVVEFLHVKPGKGAAFVRTKLRNYLTGNTGRLGALPRLALMRAEEALVVVVVAAAAALIRPLLLYGANNCCVFGAWTQWRRRSERERPFQLHRLKRLLSNTLTQKEMSWCS